MASLLLPVPINRSPQASQGKFPQPLAIFYATWHKVDMQPSKIERRTQWNLIQIAEAWCTVTGGNLSSAGRQAVGDSRFFTKLIERYAAGEREPGDREGSITTRVYDETISWFCDRKNWPDGKVRLPDIDDPFSKPKGKKNGRSAKRLEEQESTQIQAGSGLASDLLAKLRGG